MHDYDSGAQGKLVKTARPKRTIVCEANIPDDLKQLPQWCVWRYVWKFNKKKNKYVWTKIPYLASSQVIGRAKSNDPSTWATYQAAVDYYRSRKGIDGIGFFLGDSGIVAGDLDNKEGDGLHPEAETWIDIVQSYCELSPSEKGLRFFARGSLPCEKGKKPRYRRGSYELYDSSTNRFMTVTGWQIGPVKSIEERTNEVAKIHRQWILPEPDEKQQKATAPARPVEAPEPLPNGITVEDVVTLASAAKNGEKFRRLWAGKWEAVGYASESEADLALCDLIAFYVPDATQIDTVFRASGLMRDKWTNRDDYRAKTIEKALVGVSAHFTDWAEYLRRKQGHRVGTVVPTSTWQARDDKKHVEPPINYEKLAQRDESAAEDLPIVEPKPSNGLQRGSFFVEDTAIEFAEPLIEGHLDCETVALIVGEPGAYKTFIAVEMVGSISTGKRYLGLHEVKQGPVVFICGESPKGIVKRFHAWMLHHKVRPNRNLLLITRPLDFMNWDDVTSLIAEIKAAFGDRKPVAIFGDTLSTLMRGDENLQKDAGLVLANCRVLSKEFGASVVLVHHPGKDKSKGARGSSVLLGNMDTHILVERTDKQLSIVSHAKNKEDEQFASYLVQFPKVTLLDAAGKPIFDRNGKQVTSLVAEPSTSTVESIERSKRRSDKAQEWARWLRLLPTQEGEAVSPAELEKSPGVKVKKRSIKIHLDELVEEGFAHHITPDTLSKNEPNRYYRSEGGSCFLVQLDSQGAV